jgi:hypothetical protein
MLRTFAVTLNLGPTLAANHVFNFFLPFNAQLVYASMCNSTANAGTLKIGTPGDDDGYLTATNFGVSGTPTEVKTPAGFTGALLVGADNGQFPHIAATNTISVTVTDHVSHMANVCVLLLFTEG